ncbi:putative UbiX-like flavin prenyltransferase [Labeo rohita]|uniref:UbiX-like flavin prenyltransferase n=1 Tax=Labeo rohita TaxID=84645 RepID=A0ABQ8MAN3_LABRO|nr:putative UbiX-like flavin prenyltransferase [Labeo rohita]
MMLVFLALKTFLPALKGHPVLVRSDNMTVVTYINHQGSLSSRSLHRLDRQFLLCTQGKLLSLRAVHVPGRLNQEADMLSRDNRPTVSIPPDCPASSGHQMGQGSQRLMPPGGPTLEESDIVSRVDSAEGE